MAIRNIASITTLETAPDAVASGTAEHSVLLRELHALHASFVWRSLARLGVREADLPDVLQEVFLTVHQKLHTLDRSSRVTTWLFAICTRKASHYRRSRARRRADAHDQVDEGATREDAALTPEEQAALRLARERLNVILDTLHPTKRAVFVMFELEGLSCAEIGDTLGIPEGTVRSRLFHARRHFEKSHRRLAGQDPTRGRS